jgi:hypothetical protein
VLLFPPTTGTGTGASGGGTGVNNAATSTSSANSGTAGPNGMPHYGCLRRVVKRGPPYDFSVDRRCVWKFCLFEQFSDNNIKLSVKDRNAKKVSFLFDAVLPKRCQSTLFRRTGLNASVPGATSVSGAAVIRCHISVGCPVLFLIVYATYLRQEVPVLFVYS